jgi:cytochrome c oxidase subunit II
MQAFGPQLTDEQIAAIITYERNSWGNDNNSQFGKNAGGLVQPADIAKARNP